MSDESASNALVTVVRFYSEALARSEQARQQAEATLRKVVLSANAAGPSLDIPTFALARAAANLVEEHRRRGSDLFIDTTNDPESPDTMRAHRVIQELNDRYDDYRDALARVEPPPAREGAVRAAPADGAADVPRPDR